MTRYQKATESVFMNLTTTQIAALNSICKRTLAAQPELRNWICPVEVAQGVVLPFLPIRSFRLRQVSRYRSQEECLAATGAARAFFSSGSTQSVRARHLLSAEGLHSYAQSACSGLASVMQRFGIPPKTPILSLVPNEECWPESSLAAMIGFWQNEGYPVHFINLQNDPAALHKKINNLSQHNSHPESPLIIFGTSLHHLQVSQWNDRHNFGRHFIPAQRAWCFDTGGTKGRTQTTTHAALSQKITSWFPKTSQVSILSEYGMCELSSQAYSSHDPHNGTFKCSPELRSFALAPDLRSLQPIGQAGFLAFIDFANVDSWPCIVSEDLGTTSSEFLDEFELLGRAPDATLKGCSLNVRDSFQFSLNSDRTAEDKLSLSLPPIGHSTKAKRTALAADLILSSLSKELWPSTCFKDIERSLRSPLDPQTLLRLLERKELDTKKIAIVASANIPISWLYPALHAWLMGAHSIHLFLPAVRTEAPLSQLIRDQITDLAAAINNACGHPFVWVYHHRILETEDQSDFDNVVVFGSDETVTAIKKILAIKKRSVDFSGLGHFENGLKNVGMSPSAVAENCLLWLGRGCLTPLAVSAPNGADLSQKKSFAQDTFRALCAGKKQRIAEYPDQSIFKYEPFAHQQNLIEIKILFTENNIQAQIHHDPDCGVVVLDLSAITRISDHIVKKCVEFAGCGWLNILHENMIDSMPDENPSPGLFDKHQGQTWYDWLTKTEKIAGK